VVSVFDAPVAADCFGGFLGADLRRAEIERDFLPALPHAVPGAAAQGRSGDPNKPCDEAMPLGFAKLGNSVEDFYATAFMTRAAVGINAFMAPQWPCVRSDGLGFGQQAGLVSLELNEEMTVCFTGGKKSFFDSAWRRA